MSKNSENPAWHVKGLKIDDFDSRVEYTINFVIITVCQGRLSKILMNNWQNNERAN